jgi:hypothetical protein
LYSSEIRPIIGWHLGKFDFIVNPIFDNSWKGFNNLDFAPAVRIAYNFSQTWAVAAEEYAYYGPIKHFLSAISSHNSFSASSTIKANHLTSKPVSVLG